MIVTKSALFQRSGLAINLSRINFFLNIEIPANDSHNMQLPTQRLKNLGHDLFILPISCANMR